MAELRPDSWRMEELLCLQPLAPGQCPGSLPRPRKRPVTDILTWIECFSVMAAVITSKYPEKAPQLFSYSRMIVRASQTFEGPAWVSYDSQFRRKAALLKSWDWGSIDSGLYNECFTGRAKIKVLCKYCLSDAHSDQQCPLVPQLAPQSLPISQPAPRSQPFSATGNARPSSSPGQSRMVELCGLFNRPTGNGCTFSNCRYAHICSLCRQGPHPASTCSKPRKAILPPQ